MNIKLDEGDIAWKYQNNTVIISYDKPDEVIELEKKRKNDVQKMGVSDGGINSGFGGQSAAKSLLGGPGGTGDAPPDCK